MRRFSLPIVMLTFALVTVVGPLATFGQRPIGNILKQARQQRKMQQGDRPIDRRNQDAPARVRRRPLGPQGVLAPERANKNLNPQQRFIRQQLMDALALTPDQRQRINGIHNAHQEEAIAVGQRLRQARQRLDRAMWNENYNEAVVKQLSEELAQAQADQIRLQFRVNSEIRGVITNEQIRRFRQKERELQILRRNQMRQEMEKNDSDPPPKSTDKPPRENEEGALLSWVIR